MANLRLAAESAEFARLVRSRGAPLLVSPASSKGFSSTSRAYSRASSVSASGVLARRWRAAFRNCARRYNEARTRAVQPAACAAAVLHVPQATPPAWPGLQDHQAARAIRSNRLYSRVTST
jgi:hypothetical protein